jgi:hypothetical protein
MGEEARMRVERDFDLAKNARVRAQVYEEIIAQCGDECASRAQKLEVSA